MKKVKVYEGQDKESIVLFQPDSTPGFEFVKATVLNLVAVDYGGIELRDETENSLTFRPIGNEEWKTFEFEEA